VVSVCRKRRNSLYDNRLLDGNSAKYARWIQQTRAINWYIHGTVWIVAHDIWPCWVFSTFLEGACSVLGLQTIMKRKLYSLTLANLHYWLLLIGFTVYWVSMTIAGLIQGGQDLRSSVYRRGDCRTSLYDCTLDAVPWYSWVTSSVIQHVDDCTCWNIVPAGRLPHELGYER